MTPEQVFGKLNKDIKGLTSGVASASVSGSSIIFTMNDGSTQTITFPQPKDGASIVAVSTNENNQFVFSMSDGTEIVGGEVPASSGVSKEYVDSELSKKANNSDIPTKVSGLQNDSNYQTDTDVATALTPYAKSADVTKEITNKVAEIVADAPEDFNTLKEMSDWISNHENDASAMNSAISDNKNAITALQTGKADKSEIPATVAELTDSTDYAKKNEIPDVSGYITEEQLLAKDYADKAYVTEEITKASTGGEIDLSAYLSKVEATETYVTKESGKSLIEDTEIERLAGVDNYDDTEIDNRVKAIEDDYIKDTDLAAVAKSGSYNDLTDTPVIPSIEGLAKAEDIPTTVAELTDSTDYAKKTDLNNEISRAKEAEEVLKSRIDNITSIPGGSTTGDVELQDIRVKADGTTATSAGNAVREQFNELKSDVVLLDNLLKKTLAQEYDLKIAIDNMFKCAAYDSDSNYASAYENFKIACGLSDILYISAVFNGESAIAGTDAKDLDITVTGHYADGKTITLTGWKISGTVMVGTNNFTVVLGEFTTTVSVTGVKEPIPSEYTRCSYIKSSGTQYIKVPTKAMIAGTDKFIADFEINEDAGNDTMVFGGYTGNGTGRIGLNWKDGYINYNGANSWVYSQSGFELSPNIRAVAILDTKNGIAQLGESTSEFTPKSYTSSILCIFGYYNPTNTAQNKISMTLYRFKQYRNDELFTDLVPCLRNSDNVAGLYDLVDGVFYANAGSGTFEYEVASWA